MERSSTSQNRAFLAIVAGIVAIDAVTKLLAVDALNPAYLPRPIIGETLRLTLVYNPGAAFGLHLGPWSRWIFTALTLAALVLLTQLHRSTKAGDWLRTIALSLVCGGAVGNLVDRLKSARGVVDFIDVGIGVHRWPTFNVADMAVSCGAVLLFIVLWREDMAHKRAATVADSPHDGGLAATAGSQDAPLQG